MLNKTFDHVNQRRIIALQIGGKQCQYLKIVTLLFPENNNGEQRVVIDSFLNGNNNEYFYLYGLKNQPDNIEIERLLVTIRNNNQFDSLIDNIFIE